MRMRTTLLTAALVAALLAAALVWALLSAPPALAAATVGEAAPAFSLQDLDGNRHALADYRGKVVVLEWYNPNCPVSRRHADEKAMIQLHDEYADVVWLGVNSTSPDSGDYMETAEQAAWSTERGVDYAVLHDESGEVGKAYGARTTPHMFIIDPEGVLVYNGAIDDDPPGRKDAAERTNYVDGGLTAELAGQAVSPATTKPYGCSVKY